LVTAYQVNQRKEEGQVNRLPLYFDDIKLDDNLVYFRSFL